MFCGRHFVLFALAVFPLLSLAQTPDTSAVHPGTVSVRRPRTPAAYSAKMNYMYTGKVSKHHIFFSRKEIVFTDSTRSILPPQPYTGDVNPEVKSALLTTYPREDFDWENFLKSMNYSFAFEDSTKSDSAQFVVTVSRKGEVTVKLIPYRNQDSTGRAFEKEAAKKMVTLNNWYPARTNPQGKQRLRRYDTTIMITVYAKDPAAGRLMPIEVIPRGK